MSPLSQNNHIESAVAAMKYYLKSEVHWYQILVSLMKKQEEYADKQ